MLGLYEAYMMCGPLPSPHSLSLIYYTVERSLSESCLVFLTGGSHACWVSTLPPSYVPRSSLLFLLTCWKYFYLLPALLTGCRILAKSLFSLWMPWLLYFISVCCGLSFPQISLPPPIIFHPGVSFQNADWAGRGPLWAPITFPSGFDPLLCLSIPC